MVTARRLLIVLLGQTLPAMLWAQELPTKDASGNGLDFEPQIILIEPDPTLTIQSGTATVPAETDVAAARQRFELAAKKAERWQKLAKSGVLSKVEGEQAALRAAKAEAQYHAVRLAVAKQQENVDATQIEEEERAARGRLREAELQFARNMVDRLRKLRAMRIGSVSQLQRAETALQRLEGLSNP